MGYLAMRGNEKKEWELKGKKGNVGQFTARPSEGSGHEGKRGKCRMTERKEVRREGRGKGWER